MSFLNKIFHTNKASPKNSLSSTISFLFGATTAGQNVTERTTMQNTAVYACVRVLAEGLAGLPLHIYQYAKDGSMNSSINLIFCILILFSMIPLSLSFFHQIICQLHSASFDNLLLDHPVSSIFKKGRAVIEDSVIIGPSTYSSSRSHIAAATPSP